MGTTLIFVGLVVCEKGTIFYMISNKRMSHSVAFIGLGNNALDHVSIADVETFSKLQIVTPKADGKMDKQQREIYFRQMCGNELIEVPGEVQEYPEDEETDREWDDYFKDD
eukprot:TRINITY_DN27218_c0_g1_i1.p1 TRINITY_DN27218_c0_g1~~TRINITY_DN27218_c0_g1_i1.p1  ORF type:complete len:111 (-),score=12.26 TRINITY_DN27218_c0_g1_i1:32-364(-)